MSHELTEVGAEALEQVEGGFSNWNPAQVWAFSRVHNLNRMQVAIIKNWGQALKENPMDVGRQIGGVAPGGGNNPMMP